MKYLKRFENVNKPEVGDYVIAVDNSVSNKYIEFFKSNIGKINYINDWTNVVDFTVEYDHDEIIKANVNLDNGCFTFFLSEILARSKNKDDLELYMNAHKYNL